ncbi:MAG: transcription termination factor NusA [Pseudomonadota bacterium]|nr:transcription termination factor NusA [Pseudomonadota bacterium]
MNSEEIKLFLESQSHLNDIPIEEIAKELAEAMKHVFIKSMRLDPDTNLDIEIDTSTGKMEVSRIWKIVADDALVNPHQEMTLTEALKITDEAIIDESMAIELPSEQLGLGRIAAQQLKQQITRIMREGQNKKQKSVYASQIGETISGVVKRTTRDLVVVELSPEADGVLKQANIIPRENFRVDDRIKAEIINTEPDYRNAVVELSRTSNNFLKNQFYTEVPEIHEGSIEIKAVARDPGSRAKIAVKSNDKRVDPIGACIGMRGARVQGVSNELNGERIDIILWDDDPAKIVINALSPGEIDSITINEEEKSMEITVNPEQLAQVIGRGGQNISLASELTEWKLNVVRSEETENDLKTEQLSGLLDVDTEIAAILVRENIYTADAIVSYGKDKLLEIDEFDDDIADALIERAQEASLELSLADDSKGETSSESDLSQVSGLTDEQINKLIENNIKTQNDLAELATDELLEILPIDEKKAGDLIMEARKPWFIDDEE